MERMRMAKVNIAGDDGETDYGSVEIPAELLEKAIERNRFISTWREDSVTIEIDNVSIHLHFTE